MENWRWRPPFGLAFPVLLDQGIGRFVDERNEWFSFCLRMYVRMYVLDELCFPDWCPWFMIWLMDGWIDLFIFHACHLLLSFHVACLVFPLSYVDAFFFFVISFPQLCPLSLHVSFSFFTFFSGPFWWKKGSSPRCIYVHESSLFFFFVLTEYLYCAVYRVYRVYLYERHLFPPVDELNWIMRLWSIPQSITLYNLDTNPVPVQTLRKRKIYRYRNQINHHYYRTYEKHTPKKKKKKEDILRMQQT